MLTPTRQFYKESGDSNVLNLILSFIFCNFMLGVTTCFYSLFTMYFPVIYFNFIAVIALGFAIALTAKFSNRIFKIRNRKQEIIFTILLSVTTWYSQWVWSIYFLSLESFSLNLDLIYLIKLFIRPDIIFQYIFEINSFGFWEIFGMTIKGSILWFIWLAEAAIIIFISYNNYRNYPISPFSEFDNKWFKKEYIDIDFEYISFKQDFLDAFFENPSDAIISLKKGDGLRHSKIEIYPPDSSGKSLIAINNVMVTQRGKGKKELITVLEPFYIDHHHASALRNNFTLKKASLFEF